MDSGLDNAMITGFRGIDGEHHVQLELLGALRSVLTAGEERARIDEILEQLVDYTKVHFASEQLLMRLYNYPHIQQHQADHDDAVERLDAVRATYLAPDAQLALDAVDELSDWIVGHIHSADHKLGHFLVRLGVGPG